MIASGRRERIAGIEDGPSLRRRSAVLVTGASSGIGFSTAVRLARRGTFVFAGIRRQVDGEALLRENSDRIKPMLLDVTDDVAIARARARIEGLREFRLDALVNNAGIAVGGPLELLPQEELRRQFDVNFFAPIALIQAFLPLLRESGGRIVNVSSIAGKMSMPFVGAYSASKFALEAASDALRMELRPSGVSVSVIEPGEIRTPIWRRSSEAGLRMIDGMTPAERAKYEEMSRAIVAAAQNAERTAIPPERVALAIERALFARRPRARYLVGARTYMRLAVARLPEALRDPLVLAALGVKAKRPARAAESVARAGSA